MIIDPGIHHDGSALYVPVQTPRLGDTVPVRVRVPAGHEQEVWLRVLRDAEPDFIQAVPDGRDALGGDAFYTADVTMANPVTNYRVLIGNESGRSIWLNGSGQHTRDVTDQHDFRLTGYEPGPEWALDAVVYQIFPDRFGSTGRKPTPDWAVPADWNDSVVPRGPDTPRQFFGGDLDGITAHLDHIEQLGATALYLTPFFPARSNHRYDATTFGVVDPLLGGDAALTRLSAAVHQRGLRLIGDLTTNHSGDAHEWFLAARGGRDAPEREYYYFAEDDSYASWLGHQTLPKFNMASTQLRRRFIGTGDSIVARWLRDPFDLDGWRIDVANMTGRSGPADDTTAVAREIRSTMDKVRPDAVLIAEHCHDPSGDLTGDGWQGTMNYGGFTRPVWSWLTDTAHGLPFLGVPTRVPARSGHDIVATIRDFSGSIPWKIATRQWNLLDSHDTPRFRTITGDPGRARLGTVLLLTMPGTPMIFSGDEIGLRGIDGEDSRTPFPWDRQSEWDHPTLESYRTLCALRTEHEALRRGGLRWVLVEDDVVGFLRETASERLLVVVARAPWVGAHLPASLATDVPQLLYGDLDLTATGGDMSIAGDGPGAGIWRLA